MIGRWWFGWKLFRVRGRSMAPTLLDGDYVLVRRRNGARPPAMGEVVCLRRPGEPRLVKRLGAVMPDGRFGLRGDGAASRPAIDLGLVGIDEIEGRVVARISGSSIARVAAR